MLADVETEINTSVGILLILFLLPILLSHSLRASTVLDDKK